MRRRVEFERPVVLSKVVLRIVTTNGGSPAAVFGIRPLQDLPGQAGAIRGMGVGSSLSVA
jgi:hypothetical protein